MGLFKSTFWYTAGNIFSRAIGILLLPLYSNLISTEDFGKYSLIMSAYVVLSAVYQGGIFSGFSKYYLEETDTKKRKIIFSSTFNLILLIGLFLSVIFTFSSGTISLWLLSDFEGQRLITISVWMLFIDTIVFAFLHLLKTEERAIRIVVYSIISAILNLLLNIWFVYIKRMGIEGIILAQLISGLILCVVLIIQEGKCYVFSINIKFIKPILVFSIPLFAAGILTALVDVADRFILNFLMNKEAVGIYSFSYRIAMIMNIFVISFRSAWTPFSIRNYNEAKDYSNIFGKSFSNFIMVSLFVLLSISLLTDDLFNLRISSFYFFNKAYEAGVTIIPIVLTGYLFSGLISFYSVSPYISGKSYHFLITDVICFTANIILNFIFIPVWGIIGAAFATAVGYGFGAIYLFAVSEIRIYYRLNQVFTLLISGVLLLLAGLFLKNIFFDLAAILSFLIISKIMFKIPLKFSFQ